MLSLYKFLSSVCVCVCVCVWSAAFVRFVLWVLVGWVLVGIHEHTIVTTEGVVSQI